MGECSALRSTLPDLAATPRTAWPPGVSAHLAACRRCAEALAAARLARGLVRAATRGVEPRPGFARRVAEAAAAGRLPERADPWRPARVLLPAFGTVAAAALALFLQSLAVAPVAGSWTGLVGPVSITEQLVFEPGPADPDMVLAAVLESG